MTVQGTADPRFAAVREEFDRNFAERDEVGASVCVTVDGKTVVDLWGGIANPGTKAPWNEDTVAVVWSCTKGATALCAHMLAARGVIDLDAPVARYWPEFAKGGKDRVTVRMLLNHQAGLAALREPIPTACVTGMRSSRPWPRWSRCGSRVPATATTRWSSATSSARSCGV